MASPVVDPAKLADALDAYKAGEPVDKCAAIAGVSRRTIRNHAVKAGIPLRRQAAGGDALDAAIRAYVAGGTVKSCAAMCGIGYTAFRARLIERGVPLRDIKAAHTRRKPTPEGLVDDYLGGMSVKAVAAKYGIDRNAAYRMLGDVGIDGRDRSTAMRLRWQRAKEGERHAMIDSAHEGARGRSFSGAQRAAIALARASRTFSPFETELGDMLLGLRQEVAYGVPCGPYNIDIVIAGTVAVEVFGGNWHESGHHREIFPKRFRYIFDAGYSVAIVWTDSQRHPLSIQCAQHLATLAQIAGGHPSIGRQHWVIRGDGHFLSVREDDGNEVPFVTPGGRRDD